MGGNMDGKALSKKRKIFKYNEEDILEILSEYLAEENGFDTFQSRAILVGESNKNLRAIIVIGDSEDDEISKLNLENIDSNIGFNGSH